MRQFGKRIAAVALTGALMSGMLLQASAFSYPQAYWPLQASWAQVQQNQDINGTISVAQQTYDLFKNYPLGTEVCQILEPICAKAAWCYEMRGDVDNAVLWLQRQLTYAQWLNDNVKSYQDTLLNVPAQLKQLQRPMEIYTLAQDPADVPYYGVTGEPVSGVYYGVVPNGTHVNDSAALVYVNFLDGYSVDYWLDYYSNTDSTVNNALNNGGVVELAWNFTESNAGLDAVLSADSYINEGVAALGARNCTVLLRIGAEMNCWTNLPDPQKYIQAYQKVAKAARQYDNIALVFSPNDVSNRTVTYETYYPGDQYVDWIGVSTYKNGGPGYGSSYTYADTAHYNDAFYCTGLYGSDPLTVLEELAALAEAHKKPMMISECGFGYYNKSTGADQTANAVDQFTKFYSYIPMVYPQVKAIFLFDVDLSISQYRYPLSGSSALSSAYRQTVTGGAFLQGSETQGPAYTRLSTVSEPMDTLTLYTYASLPGTGDATCRYTLDGAQTFISTSEPFAYSLDVSSLSSGTHTVTATVTKGNFTRSVTRTFLVSGGMVTGSDAMGSLPVDVSSAASWAVGNILNAESLGLLTDRTSSNFSSSITRLQFAGLAVNLIEKVTGTTLPTGDQSFQDTSDPTALKAAQAGVASGTGNGNFSPNANITRQEISVMLNQVIRCIDEAKGTNTLTNTSTALGSQFTDAGQVASWAVESMAALTNNGMMSGTSDTTLSPKNNTSIQEAITLILAMYNKF